MLVLMCLAAVIYPESRICRYFQIVMCLSFACRKFLRISFRMPCCLHFRMSAHLLLECLTFFAHVVSAHLVPCEDFCLASRKCVRTLLMRCICELFIVAGDNYVCQIFEGTHCLMPGLYMLL